MCYLIYQILKMYTLVYFLKNSIDNCIIVMTAQTMSFRYELACIGHSTEKAQDLVT